MSKQWQKAYREQAFTDVASPAEEAQRAARGLLAQP